MTVDKASALINQMVEAYYAELDRWTVKFDKMNRHWVLCYRGNQMYVPYTEQDAALTAQLAVSRSNAMYAAVGVLMTEYPELALMRETGK